VKIELQGNSFEVSGKATERMRVLMKICDRGGVFCADEKTEWWWKRGGCGSW